MSELKKCPFCGGEEMYETKRENELGTIIPQLFCNCCKMTFEIENDSPYLNDDKTYDYLKEKLHNLWNTRKSIQNIVERLEELKDKAVVNVTPKNVLAHIDWVEGMDKAIEIVKEEGGIDERN